MTTNLDAVELAAHMEETLLIVPRGSHGRTAAEAVRLLEATGTHLLGAILHDTVRGSHAREPIRRWVFPIPRRTPTVTGALVDRKTDPPQPADGAFRFEAIMYRSIWGRTTAGPESPDANRLRHIGRKPAPKKVIPIDASDAAPSALPVGPYAGAFTPDGRPPDPER
jgi:hypothetical protein